jgi:hypothetical protein
MVWVCGSWVSYFLVQVLGGGCPMSHNLAVVG